MERSGGEPLFHEGCRVGGTSAAGGALVFRLRLVPRGGLLSFRERLAPGHAWSAHEARVARGLCGNHTWRLPQGSRSAGSPRSLSPHHPCSGPARHFPSSSSVCLLAARLVWIVKL